MNRRPAFRLSGRLVAGAILILLGGIYLLDSLGVLSAGDITRYWPLILVGIGITKLSQARFPFQRIGGLAFVAIGAILLLITLHVGGFRSRDLLPILLVLIGGALFFSAVERRRYPPGGSGQPAETLERARENLASFREDNAENLVSPAPIGARESAAAGPSGAPVGVEAYLNEFAIMGGGDRIVRSQDFRGGEVTAIMGGFGIDLRGAAIATDSATVNVFTLWGGVDLKVPEEWNVSISGVPILGVFPNNARAFRQGDAAAKTLFVKGVAIMGGVEVKN
jgi:cell wall-active antibiotic response 4TMS protein YvqF